jgi:hypothetical protein
MARHGDRSGRVACAGGPPVLVTTAAWRPAGLGLPADRIRHDPGTDTGTGTRLTW